MPTNTFLRWPAKQIIGLWILLRVLTSVVALVPSAIGRGLQADINPLELTIPVWPPSLPFTTWLDRVLVQPWFRWDAQYYVWATSRGFSVRDGSASFHPLLSLLAKPIFYLTASPLFGLLVVATLATLGLYFAFLRLARLDLPDD